MKVEVILDMKSHHAIKENVKPPGTGKLIKSY